MNYIEAKELVCCPYCEKQSKYTLYGVENSLHHGEGGVITNCVYCGKIFEILFEMNYCAGNKWKAEINKVEKLEEE